MQSMEPTFVELNKCQNCKKVTNFFCYALSILYSEWKVGFNGKVHPERWMTTLAA